jgi:hypothetical protein
LDDHLNYYSVSHYARANVVWDIWLWLKMFLRCRVVVQVQEKPQCGVSTYKEMLTAEEPHMSDTLSDSRVLQTLDAENKSSN